MNLRKMLIAMFAISALIIPSSAIANPVLLTGGQLSISLMLMIQAGSLCMTYTYDQNGNRLTQTEFLVSSGTGWGTGTYGCFIWTQ